MRKNPLYVDMIVFIITSPQFIVWTEHIFNDDEDVDEVILMDCALLNVTKWTRSDSHVCEVEECKRK